MSDYELGRITILREIQARMRLELVDIRPMQVHTETEELLLARLIEIKRLVEEYQP